MKPKPTTPTDTTPYAKASDELLAALDKIDPDLPLDVREARIAEAKVAYRKRVKKLDAERQASVDTLKAGLLDIAEQHAKIAAVARTWHPLDVAGDVGTLKRACEAFLIAADKHVAHWGAGRS